jgi:hypothetical protein
MIPSQFIPVLQFPGRASRGMGLPAQLRKAKQANVTKNAVTSGNLPLKPFRFSDGFQEAN